MSTGRISPGLFAKLRLQRFFANRLARLLKKVYTGNEQIKKAEAREQWKQKHYGSDITILKETWR